MSPARDGVAWQPSAADDLPVRLTYRLDAGQMGAPLAISCVQAQQVAYQEVEASPISERSIGVLDIQYPHPANRPGMALVGVVIQQQHGPERGMPPQFVQTVRGWFDLPDEDTIVGSQRDLHEAWVLDVPKADVDQILARLRSDGYYDDGERRRGHVRMTSRIGGQTVAKEWHSVPELDALMHRVRVQGQLVSYQGISLPLVQKPSAPASLVAWRAVQNDRSFAGSPSQQSPAHAQVASAARPATIVPLPAQQAFAPPHAEGTIDSSNSLFPAPHDSAVPTQIARTPFAGPWQ